MTTQIDVYIEGQPSGIVHAEVDAGLSASALVRRVQDMFPDMCLKGRVSLGDVTTVLGEGDVVNSPCFILGTDEPLFRVLVKTMTGKTTMCSISNSVTIDGLKHRIMVRAGVPVDHQRLVFCGTRLEAGTVQQAGICSSESTIHLMVRPCGGDGDGGGDDSVTGFSVSSLESGHLGGVSRATLTTQHAGHTIAGGLNLVGACTNGDCELCFFKTRQLVCGSGEVLARFGEVPIDASLSSDLGVLDLRQWDQLLVTSQASDLDVAMAIARLMYRDVKEPQTYQEQRQRQIDAEDDLYRRYGLVDNSVCLPRTSPFLYKSYSIVGF